MRRILLLAVGALALALAAPSVASAHFGRHHHKHHHHRHHKAHRADLTGRAAGTIASFDGTTLTITLANGSTVSGVVTDETEIDVMPASAPMAAAAHHGGGDWGDDHDRGEHRGWCGSSNGDASDLVPGATVLRAKLEIDPDGATFEKVVVERPASSTTS